MTFFIAGAAVVALGACNNPAGSGSDEEGTVIQLAPMGENIANSEELDKLAAIVAFDLRDRKETKGLIMSGVCLMINSTEELPKVTPDGNPVNLQLPDIDFNSYTLVIGLLSTPDTGWLVKNQSVVVKQKEITLQMELERVGGFMVPMLKSFWSLYPKLPQLPINVALKY